jgi:hypothetical protein
MPDGGTEPLIVHDRDPWFVYLSLPAMSTLTVDGPGVEPETGRVKSGLTPVSPRSIASVPVADIVPPTIESVEGNKLVL